MKEQPKVTAMQQTRRIQSKVRRGLWERFNQENEFDKILDAFEPHLKEIFAGGAKSGIELVTII